MQIELDLQEARLLLKLLGVAEKAVCNASFQARLDMSHDKRNPFNLSKKLAKIIEESEEKKLHEENVRAMYNL